MKDPYFYPIVAAGLGVLLAWALWCMHRSVKVITDLRTQLLFRQNTTFLDMLSRCEEEPNKTLWAGNWKGYDVYVTLSERSRDR